MYNTKINGAKIHETLVYEYLCSLGSKNYSNVYSAFSHFPILSTLMALLGKEGQHLQTDQTLTLWTGSTVLSFSLDQPWKVVLGFARVGLYEN